MRILVRAGIFAAVLLLQLSGISFAKLVYLKDGSELECQSFQRSHRGVFVKVNRDVVLDFEASEVDMARTFPPAKHKHHRVGLHKKGALHRPAQAMAAAGAPGSTVHALRAKTVPSSAPDAKSEGAQPGAPKTAKPATPPAPKTTPATPAPKAPAPIDPAANKEPTKHSAAPPQKAAAEKGAPSSGPANTASADSKGPLSKEEFERRSRENADKIAQAVKNRDLEAMKKAVEAQKNLAEQQKQPGQQHNQAGPKPEPPWFKYLLMMMACMLITLIALWVVFVRAGQSGWKSIIPIYNMYVLMVISGKPGWWFLLMLVPVVGTVFLLLAMLSLAGKFGRSAVFGVGLTFLPMFFFPMMAFGRSRYESRQEEMNFTFSDPPQA